MTAPLSHQTVTVKDPATVRKRRRRAPAGGAADDCFACSKRNVKCDRRRPYCSQCLEVGNECSGYKTQLTWGVGVASRGKLRGLSLPIAKAPPVAREPKKAPVARARSNSAMTTLSTHWDEHDEVHHVSHRGAIDIPAAHSSYSNSGYDYLSMSHPEHTHMHPQSIPHGCWSSVHYNSPPMMQSPDERTTPKFSKWPLPIITDGLSSSVDSLSEVDYLSPMSQGYSRDDMPPFGHSPTVGYDGFPIHHQTSPISRSPPPTLLIDSSRVSDSCGLIYGGPSDSSSSLTSQLDHFESMRHPKSATDCDGLSAPDVNNGNCNAMSPGWHTRVKEEDSHSPLSELSPNHWPSIRDQPQPRIGQDVTAKMSFFMDYYKMTMAPSMVVIDTPHNPFKSHLLQLASGSQSLQHAICALASCNLRMKRRLSLGQDTRELYGKLIAEKRATENAGDAPPQDPSHAEEIQHRNLAVQLLNQQLSDPVKSRHDSVLATILILCHYRMAESGIAKFHTQFAGVKKILAMRSPQQFGGSTGDVAWMETLFSYFDAISATINDREAQLTSIDDGFATGTMPAGAVNMVGCDRELFETIGKLGRLNMLSQHRPVQNMAGSMQAAGDSPLATHSMGHGYRNSISSVQSQTQGAEFYATPSSQRFDGNGFGTLLDDDELLTSAMSTSTAFDDRRALFWAEWKDARQALQHWHFDVGAVASELPGGPNPSHLRDLESLSEAFRYAAMLYTERLASPSLPSSHTNFQNLVSQVVYYATSLEAGSSVEKFLLWPLFIAGSECVNELQQMIVRSKCKDIMTRSGYMNNLAALDVLERLWSGDFRNGSEMGLYDGQAKMGGARGPFNWSKCFGGPGVGVEWIMF
ncbi:hypothetical protein MY4824_009047 [Beauveria thailandica]